MTDSVAYDQNMVGEGGEVMEVMMTGGDGGEMNQETLKQVVEMLQGEGQLTGGNHTIIIRQPGSNEIQMIQTSNGGGFIFSKASEADIQALQASNGILENVNQDIFEGQQGQMVMMDEGGNLVEGVVQMQEDESQSGVMQLTQDGQLQAITDTQTRNLMEVSKNGDVGASEILEGLVQMDGIGSHHHPSLMETIATPDPPSLSTKPITISTTTSKQKPKTATGLNGEVVSIKISTGLSKKKENKPPRISPKDVIKISTVTGQQKYQPPKFHKCEACAINFVSKVAYMNHMENCPSKRKSLSTVNNKGNVTYTCVFCETKFNSRLVLMQHVRTCDKAKSSKSLAANSKLKVTTSESKLKLVSSGSLPKPLKGTPIDIEKKQKKLIPSSKLKENKVKLSAKRKSILDLDDEPFLSSKGNVDSDYEDDKDIVYDDDEDVNEEFLGEDDNIEETLVNKRSQKHLGPIIVKGMFKCRDCNRTFSKEYQYNRHVKACTNAPLNVSKIDTDAKEVQLNTIPVSAGEAVPAIVPGKRKRGRPPSKGYASEDVGSPTKKRALGGPKIVSINPKKVGSVRGRPRIMNFSDNESDEEIMNYLSGGSSSRVKEDVFGKKNEKIVQKLPLKKPTKDENFSTSSSSFLNKIVKINPTDTLIKQTGKAILSKMNKEKCSKLFKEMPFCGLCGDKFKTVHELSVHTQICHSEDLLNLRDSLDGKGNLSSVKCPLCDLHFVSPHILLFHMVSFHEKDLKSVQEELESQNLNLVCPFCSELILTQDLLKEHIATKHLDRLISKPSNTVSPITLDVHAFIKEKNNGSMLPTSKLLAKKEKVLCPECGLFFFKSYFEHHRCAAETYSSSARKFICSESQCSGLAFYKLIHLLTHLQQVHEKSLSCKEETFDNMAQFLEWLKKEEAQTKMKFTKALQRMKQGKLSTVWICHRFHNSMKDPTSINGDNETRHQTDRLNQCYSRIHAETYYSPSTSRYDGRTSVKYYPYHQHPSENETKNVQYQPTPILHPPLEVEKQPISLQTFTAEESTFSDAAELKQLLEDDDDFDGQKSKHVDSSFDAQQLAQFEDLEKETTPSLMETEGSDLFKDNFSKSTAAASQNQDELVTPNQTLETIDDPDEENEETRLKSDVEKILNEEESLPSSELSEKLESKDTKEVSGLVSLSDADLLLEKMLGEHDGGENSSVDPMDTEEARPSSQADVVADIENLAPTEAKITEVDMLEAFGDCITPEESSNSTTSNTLLNSISSEQPEPEQEQEEQEQEQEEQEQEEQEQEQEEQEQEQEEQEQEQEKQEQKQEKQEQKQEEQEQKQEEQEQKQEEQEQKQEEQEQEQEQQEQEQEEQEQEKKEQEQKKTEQELVQEQEQEQDQVHEQEQKMKEQQNVAVEENQPEPEQDSEVHKELTTGDPPLAEEEELDSKIEEEEEEEEMEDEEESTYVLPADMEEWSKLFELVSAQVSSKGIPDSEIEEAKTLLCFENSIMSLEIEKQIDVFNQLCALANVQMT